MSSLDLKTAERIVDAALQHARSSGFAPLCVAVLDAGGHLITLKREDGASLLRPQIASGKARACLGMGFGGRELARRAAAAPMFFTALIGLAEGNMVAVPGGVLIRDAQGVLHGAIGISGDTSDNDEACALAGITAVHLVAETGG